MIVMSLKSLFISTSQNINLHTCAHFQSSRTPRSNVLYTSCRADYMESIQPGLSFCPVKKAEIPSRLHEQFELGLSLVTVIYTGCIKKN